MAPMLEPQLSLGYTAAVLRNSAISCAGYWGALASKERLATAAPRVSPSGLVFMRGVFVPN